jgi:DNA polymerase III alpha subunit
MPIRSGYSFNCAFGRLETIINVLQEHKETTYPIADRVSTFAFTKATTLLTNTNIRPIYGVELPVAPTIEPKPPIDYWTFLATDDIKPLNDLIYTATSNPTKMPALTYYTAQKAIAGGLIAITGERLLINELSDDYPLPYLALSPATPYNLLCKAFDRGLEIFARSDNLYPRKEDQEIYRVALGFRSTTQTYPQHILSRDELYEALRNNDIQTSIIDEAYDNRDYALSLCKAKLNYASLLSPPRPASLLTLCQRGAIQKSCPIDEEPYRSRLATELRLIEEKKFEDYFYILYDIINWARQRMLVGPARGSSAGSLVCYLLNITTIDPIKYNLIFERFIDVNRADLPDVDIDFSDVNRHLVFDYAEQQYGKQHVARLGSVNMFKEKSTVKQVFTSLKIPMWRLNQHRSSICDDYPSFEKAVTEIENNPFTNSQHAAGVLITDKPMSNYVAVDARTGAVWCDKDDAENLNLLKIDALGLTQLSIFERIQTLIGKPLNLDAIPLDDKRAFEVMNKRRYTGIFQFGGSTIRRLADQITFKTIDDFIIMTALSRPGPLDSGGAAQWIDRKNSENYYAINHEIIEPFLEDTLGIIIYQEQVMNIVRCVGQFSWADTSKIRRIMAKSKGNEELEEYWPTFLEGAKSQGLYELEARHIWDQVNTFGRYAFNLAHATSYGIISYWCAYLKAEYPLEFGAATLDSEKDTQKQLEILRELHDEGINYRAIDPDYSEDKWKPVHHENTLVGPLLAIKGIGPSKYQQIIESRKHNTPLTPGLQAKLETAKTEIDILFPIMHKINIIHPDLTKINIWNPPTPIKKISTNFRGDFMFFGVLNRLTFKDENSKDRLERRGWVINGDTKILGMFFFDDTDEIYAQIGRFQYDKLAPLVLAHQRLGSSMFAVKGKIPKSFRMINIMNIRYLGELKDGYEDDDLEDTQEFSYV